MLSASFMKWDTLHTRLMFVRGKKHVCGFCCMLLFFIHFGFRFNRGGERLELLVSVGYLFSPYSDSGCVLSAYTHSRSLHALFHRFRKDKKIKHKSYLNKRIRESLTFFQYGFFHKRRKVNQFSLAWTQTMTSKMQWVWLKIIKSQFLMLSIHFIGPNILRRLVRLEINNNRKNSARLFSIIFLFISGSALLCCGWWLSFSLSCLVSFILFPYFSFFYRHFACIFE